MTYEAKTRKLNNMDNLPTLEEINEDQRLLNDAMMKIVAEPGKSSQDHVNLASLLISSLTLGNGKR